jgi:hypothetical protein
MRDFFLGDYDSDLLNISFSEYFVPISIFIQREKPWNFRQNNSFYKFLVGLKAKNTDDRLKLPACLFWRS